jgi:uncharacterized oligopeptide transporter (OPT) family protein
MNMEEAKEKKEIEREEFEKLPADNEPDHQGPGPKRIQPWTQQITVRGIVVSIIIGSMYSIIAMKFSITTGILPHLNVSAALLAFLFIRTWIKLLHRAGIVSKPFTRQENTMIQTCVVACYSIAGGGLSF